MGKKKAIFGVIIGSFSTFVGAMGASFSALGFCLFCFAPIAGLLGFFGISVGFLADYNIYFISFGVLMLIIGITLFIKGRKCKTCKIK